MTLNIEHANNSSLVGVDLDTSQQPATVNLTNNSTNSSYYQVRLLPFADTDSGQQGY